MEVILSLLIGISLSATTGFRIFVPLFFLSIASLAGWVELSPAFNWVGSYTALTALTIAMVLETGAYFFPFIDNLLGTLSAPVSLIAGTLITSSLMIDLPPILTWTLAAVAGGGAALGGSAVSNVMHGASTSMTGGTANIFLSLAETIFSLIISVLAVLVPVLAFLLLVIFVFIMVGIFRRINSSRPRNKHA